MDAAEALNRGLFSICGNADCPGSSPLQVNHSAPCLGMGTHQQRLRALSLSGYGYRAGERPSRHPESSPLQICHSVWGLICSQLIHLHSPCTHGATSKSATSHKSNVRCTATSLASPAPLRFHKNCLPQNARAGGITYTLDSLLGGYDLVYIPLYSTGDLRGRPVCGRTSGGFTIQCKSCTVLNHVQ